MIQITVLRQACYYFLPRDAIC